MKIYITKYALTDGIKEAEAEFFGDIQSQEMVKVVGVYGPVYSGKSWHRTREEAVARAEQMRLAKIRSLEKHANRLKNLKFT